MSNGREVFVCGFGDVAAGVAGLAWELGEPAAALLQGERAQSGSFALEEGGDAATLEISVGSASADAVLSPGIDPVLLREGNGDRTLAVTPCAAEVRRSGADTVECRGQITRWSGDPLAGAATFRHLAIEAGDGALLVAVARGEPGAAGHGEERASAWRIDADGTESAFEEALISTQYSGAGRPTRVGLELWPGEDAPPMRVACSILGSAEISGGWASFLHARTDGAEGIGSYLLWRA